MSNTYISEDSGSLKPELVGGAIGGLTGALGINAIGALQNYKADIMEIEGVKNKELPELEGQRSRVQAALDDAQLLHQIRKNPKMLDGMGEEARGYYAQIYDAANRLQGQSDFDRIHELPFHERIKLFIKGKPSLREVDPELITHVVGKFGHRPFDQEVLDTLMHQGNQMDNDLSMLREVAKIVPKYDVKAALPTLDLFKPKRLLGTIGHPAVAGTAALGYIGGKIADEYKNHLEVIKHREDAKQEMPKEAGFSSVFKKLLPKKPIVAPELTQTAKKPLIPKSVKRTGLLLGGAGVAGYSAVKAKNDFTTGMKMTPSAQKLEGMDSNMNKTAALYAELEKVALNLKGVKDGAEAVASKAKGHAGNVKDVISGKKVKDAKDVLDSRRVVSGLTGEPIGELAAKNLQKEKVKRAGAIAGAGAVGVGAGAAGAVAYNHHKKSAGELYAELEKVALNVKGVKDVVSGKGVKDAKDVLESRKVMSGLTGEPVGELAVKKLRNEKAKRAGVIAGAGTVGVGAGAAGAIAHREEHKKKASELYAELEKVAFNTASLKAGAAKVGDKAKDLADSMNLGQKAQSFKDGAKNLAGEAKDIVTGKKVKDAQAILDTRKKMHIETGESIGRVAPRQLQKEKAKQLGAFAGIGVAGAAATGGAAVAIDRQRNKTAGEIYEDLMKEAGALQGLKNLGGKLAGKPAKQIERYQAELGESAHMQQHIDKAKSGSTKARLGVAGAGLAAAGTVGGVMAAKSGQSDAQQKKADEEATDIEKVAHEAINSLFGDKVDAILEDKLEKIASHTDPLDRITFGYENLKK